MRPTAMPIIMVLAPLLVAVAATSSGAQIVNGGFASGGTGWTLSSPPTWSPASFPASGGNPGRYARVFSPFGDSQGEGCISQTFACTDPNGCSLSVDYKLQSLDASPFSGRVKVYFNGELALISPATDVLDWATECFNLTRPGTYTIGLCLGIDAGNNAWEACFDNVGFTQCQGTTPASRTDWGTVKSLYRD
jgi:hypothetical protein